MQSDALVDFLRAGPPDAPERGVVRSGLAAAMGNGNHPYSSYSTTALPPASSAFGTPPCGIIGVHRPREVLRVERDWSGGDVCQFHTTYPMELEGRITPTQWQRLINTLNTHLLAAHSLPAAAWENALAVLTWQTSLWWYTSRFESEIREVEKAIGEANDELWNEQGLNVLSPRKVAFQFLEIEYY